MIPPIALSLLTNRYVLAAAAGAAVLFGAWWWHTSRVDAAVEEALTAERNRLTAELLVAERRIHDLERQHAETLALLGQHYQKEFQDAEARRKADVAAARDGALRLRVPGTLCPGPGGEAAAAAGGSDGAAGGELPGAVAADLLELVHDADRNARQLAACQAVIRAQIATVNQEPTP